MIEHFKAQSSRHRFVVFPVQLTVDYGTNRVKVMQTKDFTKWNYDSIQEVVDGLMYNPKRLEEVIKARFIRRLMSFYSPFSHRFSDILRERVSFVLLATKAPLLTWVHL